MSHPLVSASTDAVLYVQGNPSIVEAEPYYPSSYVSPAIASDGSLKIPNQSGYELLSTSHVGTSNGSSRDDYSQSLVVLEHPAQWSGLWEGVTDWHQSKKMQLDGGFSAKENFINQGILVSLFCFVITENQFIVSVSIKLSKITFYATLSLAFCSCRFIPH